MKPYHASILRRLPGVMFITYQTQKPTREEIALQRRLRADKWPFVGVRCVSFALADGSQYTPSLVTVDEGVVVCWEPEYLGHGLRLPRAARLPALKDPTVYYTSTIFVNGDWLDCDRAPLSDIDPGLNTQEARDAHARSRMRRGLDSDTWTFRDWAVAATKAMQRKCARLRKAHGEAPLPLDPIASVTQHEGGIVAA